MKFIRPALLVALAAAAPAQTPKLETLRVGNEPWHLVLPLGDLQLTQGFPSRADRQVSTYRNDKGVMLSVIVENARAPASLESCRRVFERRKQGTAQMRPANEVQSQQGEAATQEYDLKLGSAVHHNIHSCRVRGTYYIDVHASKSGYRPSDRAALMALVNAVRIVD